MVSLLIKDDISVLLLCVAINISCFHNSFNIREKKTFLIDK